MSLGRKIAQLRNERGMTQRDLADRLDINQSMVTRWEKDQVQPKSSTLERLAQALEVTVEELFPDSETDTARPTTIRGLANRELAELLSQVNELDSTDQMALQAVLEAMLTKRRIQTMVGSRKTA